MGSEQSQPEKTSKPVRIDRSEIPEAYLNVAVSEDVVRRAKAQGGVVDDEEKKYLEEQLRREREANYNLRLQMQQLSDLQQRVATNTELPPKQESISLEDMQERSKVFDDTVDRVKKQFFSFQRENACGNSEAEILSCLDKSNGQYLKCSPLLPNYYGCIEDFRKEVLVQKS